MISMRAVAMMDSWVNGRDNVCSVAPRRVVVIIGETMKLLYCPKTRGVRIRNNNF